MLIGRLPTWQQVTFSKIDWLVLIVPTDKLLSPELKLVSSAYM